MVPDLETKGDCCDWEVRGQEGPASGPADPGERTFPSTVAVLYVSPVRKLSSGYTPFDFYDSFSNRTLNVVNVQLIQVARSDPL